MEQPGVVSTVPALHYGDLAPVRLGFRVEVVDPADEPARVAALDRGDTSVIALVTTDPELMRRIHNDVHHSTR